MPHAHWIADPNARLLALAAGAALLVLGRRLFWLFVGIVGFFTVYQLSLEALHIHPVGMRLFLAAVAGLFGMLLAIFVQRVAVALSGFAVGAWLAAGFLGLDLAHLSAVRPGVALLLLVAGILAAILALRLFDFALIAFSSLLGAGLIADAAHLAGSPRTVVFVLLAVAGIAVQAGWTGRRRERAR
jgi:hypothetical protein